MIRLPIIYLGRICEILVIIRISQILPTYQPLLQNYDDLMNLTVDYIGGDGQTESNITNRLGNPGEYDAFAINMVKTDNATSYTSLLQQ